MVGRSNFKKMTMTSSFSLLAQALGWAVLHSFWQIALIWLAFISLRWVFRHRNQWIYLLSLAAMSVPALWFAATFASQYARLSALAALEAQRPVRPEAVAFPLANAPNEMAAVPDPGFLESAGVWLESHAVQVGWAWGICVVLLWLRLLGGWWMVQRLRHRDVVAPEASFQNTCEKLAKKLKINALVRVLESPHVSEPLTLGFWKPLILFPTGMLLSLSPAQVEALLLHELAHIRRYDYLVNLVQLVLDTCFFYHPLFMLISRDARVRREFCCDDVVLYHTSDPLLYAKTLTDLQISFLHPTTQFTMNATGKSRFTERILRIAGITPKRENRPNWLIVLLLPTLIAIGSWWPTQAASPAPEVTSNESLILSDTLPPQQATQPKARGKVAEQQEQAKPARPRDAAGDPANQRIVPSSEKVAIEAVKMNVLYIGVDNPLRIAVAGVPANELNVELIGQGSITGGDGQYVAHVVQPGEVTVRVTRKAGTENRLLADQKYRVKRIPDPSPMLPGAYRGGIITKENLMASKSLLAMLMNFDFDAVCTVIGYEITILAKEQDPITINAKGADIPASAWDYIEKLSGDGDAIFFDDIKVLCPGDQAPRNIGGIAFKLRPAADGN